MEREATIRVTGKGMLRLKPDVTRITITLIGCYKDYGESLRRSSEDTESLAAVLGKLDFAREDLKTLNFSVQTRMESYQTKNHEWKERFVGYEFRHVMKLDFPSDSDRLGRVLYALAHADVNPEFRLSYTVKDPEASKNALLAAAVADARAKAGVLAASSGVTLGKILRIDYSMATIDFECRPMNDGLMLAKACGTANYGSYTMDIQPDDIEVTDTVTVVWTLTGKGAAE